jgi:hypothetical protein
VLWSLLSLSAVLASGCGSEDGERPGVMVVPFELGNARECGTLGVRSVRAVVDGGDFVEEVDCDAGMIRFNLMMPGTYRVALYGLDERGVPVMDSLAVGPHEITVIGDGTTVVADPAIQLTAAPARLLLRWDFGFGSCESTGVTSFGVTAWREDGSELLLDTEIPCNLQGEGREQYRLVPDLERELSGDEVGEVEIQPYDGNGVAVGDSVTYLFAAPGPGQGVRLSLSCDDGGCEGSGQPDWDGSRGDPS